MLETASLVFTCILALVHVFVGRTRILDKNPDVWKSAAGGVGIAYAFLVLLPKIGNAQPILQKATDPGIYGFFEHHSYLVALLGLVLYYGLDIAVETLLVLPQRRALRPAVATVVYIHAAFFSGYYLLIGYLLAKSRSYMSLSLFTVAMVLHFLATDSGVRHKYPGLYERFVRWIFVASTFGGWVFAMATEVRYTTLAIWNSLFAGALIINTIKEKVPSAHGGRFWPFLVGVGGYSLLLLFVEFFDKWSR